jgi:hypothetical protein
MSTECLNKKEILAYAAMIGVKNASIEDHGLLNWHLLGTGKSKGQFPRSLVCLVAEDCGMFYGGGGADWVQIRPGQFKLPVAA